MTAPPYVLRSAKRARHVDASACCRLPRVRLVAQPPGLTSARLATPRGLPLSASLRCVGGALVQAGCLEQKRAACKGVQACETRQMRVSPCPSAHWTAGTADAARAVHAPHAYTVRCAERGERVRRQHGQGRGASFEVRGRRRAGSRPRTGAPARSSADPRHQAARRGRAASGAAGVRACERVRAAAGQRGASGESGSHGALGPAEAGGVGAGGGRAGAAQPERRGGAECHAVDEHHGLAAAGHRQRVAGHGDRGAVQPDHRPRDPGPEHHVRHGRRHRCARARAAQAIAAEQAATCKSAA